MGFVDVGQSVLICGLLLISGFDCRVRHVPIALNRQLDICYLRFTELFTLGCHSTGGADNLGHLLVQSVQLLLTKPDRHIACRNLFDGRTPLLEISGVRVSCRPLFGVQCLGLSGKLLIVLGKSNGVTSQFCDPLTLLIVNDMRTLNLGDQLTLLVDSRDGGSNRVANIIKRCLNTPDRRICIVDIPYEVSNGVIWHTQSTQTFYHPVNRFCAHLEVHLEFGSASRTLELRCDSTHLRLNICHIQGDADFDCAPIVDQLRNIG